MYSATHSIKELNAHTNLNAFDKTSASSMLTSMMSQLKNKLVTVLQTPARMPQDLRNEMYW